MATRPCSQCRKEVVLSTVDSMAGEAAGVRMSIVGMPVLACAEGHRRFLAPDFALTLIDALLPGEPLVPVAAATQKGLLRKRLHCPGCGKELAQGAGETHVEAKRVLELKRGAAFEVRVEVPTFRCSCGKESVSPEDVLGEALMKASVHAFRSAAVTPT